MHEDSLLVQPLSQPVNASLTPPGSKSYTNRALPIAALADGVSVISGALFSDDTRYMAQALRQLGIGVLADEAAQTFTVTGTGGRLQPSSEVLFIGNSGTSARFLTPLVALGSGEYIIDGVPAMRKRPIGPLTTALNALGGSVTASDTGCPPLQISARGIRGGRYAIRGDLSSQYLSGLLMSAPYFAQGLELTVIGELVSKPYLQVTGQTMGAFGVAMKISADFSSFAVAAGHYSPAAYPVEPDASAASYLFAAAAITGGCVTVPGLGTDSLQGDLNFVRVLEQMGCAVTMDARQTTVVGPATLRGVTVDMSQISDTAQTLAAVAVFADSPTRVTGIGFIRGKETDRVAAVVTELQRLGIEATEEDDGFVIQPGATKAAAVQTYDDHRMAMSFALIGLRNPGVTILEPACVAKTFPTYWDVLESLRG
jgi:3-phosphoshikimate 1-carboxyvinyltransferase